MYKTPLQKCNILMCFTHWINLSFTLKVATTVLGSPKFLLLRNSVPMECYGLLNGFSKNRHKSSHLLNRQIYCDVAESLQILIIWSVFLNNLWNTWDNSCDGDPSNFHRHIYWHCKNIGNLRLIFGVNMIYEYMILKMPPKMNSLTFLICVMSARIYN